MRQQRSLTIRLWKPFRKKYSAIRFCKSLHRRQKCLLKSVLFLFFLPENLEMTANREKPEQLTFFFFEEMPKPTKGTIYLDTSKKGVTKFKTRRHNSYRAEVTYNGVKYRKRSAERADCEQFLAQLAEKYEKGLL